MNPFIRLVPLALAGIVWFCWPGVSRAAYSCPSGKSYPAEDSGFWAGMSYRKVSTPSGAIVLAEGVIMPAESARLEAQIKSAMSGPRGVYELQFNSPGGDSSEGQLMGKVIRRLGVPTRITSGSFCVSACSVAFLGGVFRTVEPGGHYAVHMFSSFGGSDENRYINNTVRRLQGIEQESAQRAADRYQYLLEMGISPNVARHGFSVENKESSCPPIGVLKQWNVDNSSP